jgi:dipeptidase D
VSDSTPKPTLDSLEPAAVWNLFSAMSAVPRPSKREEKIQAHMRQTAEKLGLTHRSDSIGNIVIDVPATPGHEAAPLIVLQGHLDMVCEKNAGTEHDFDQDPIRLELAEDAAGAAIVQAAGTTLGADNGIGVCLALAAATEPEVTHGPLEILLTTDEEEGMTGALALDPKLVRGKRLLNLDSEEDHALYIGCAGGCDSTVNWSFPARPTATSELYRLRVRGLRGGHSGGDIHEGRGAATKLLVRTLQRSGQEDLQLIRIDGGSKRNALAREAEALVAGGPGLRQALEQAAAAVTVEGKTESSEPGLSIEVEVSSQATTLGLSARDTNTLLCALVALPHGVLGMHPKVPGLVETSNNLATLHSSLDDGNLEISAGMLSRSSSDTRIEETKTQIAAIGALSGARVEHSNAYPGWEPDVSSPLLVTCRQVHQEVFGSEPEVAAIHAGLECGLIGQRLGGMDMISFGPRIEGAHSPDERVWVDSVEKSWRYLKAVLAALAA